MDVCFTARVSNKKQSIVIAVASQDELTVTSDQTRYWLLVPREKALLGCALVLTFLGERQILPYTKSQTNKIFFSFTFSKESEMANGQK